MKRIIRNLILTVASAATILAPSVAPVMVGAQAATPSGANIGTSLCGGIELQSTEGVCGTPADQDSSLNNIIKLVINTFSVIVGVISVLMIIYGGFKYITSGGDSGKVTGAKNTILYALIGLVIVAIAQLIVRFVVAKAGSTITTAPAA